MADPGNTHVEIVEVGPRDGLQNEQRVLPVGVRVDLLRRLVAAGARRIEAVSFVHPDRVPQMAGAEVVLEQLGDPGPGVSLIGLVLNRRGAERAAQTSCREVNVVVPVTDAFCERNQGQPVAGMLDHAAAAAQSARAAGMRVSVTLAVAFGCPFSGPVSLERVAEVLEPVLAMDPDEVAFADTIGVGVPPQVTSYAALLPVPTAASTPRLRFHFHNTRNTGYANAWTAAILDRPVALDASLGGFGGCPFAPAATGNIATEDLTYLIARSGLTVEGPAIDQTVETASWLAGHLGRDVDALLGRAGGFAGVGGLRTAEQTS